MTNSERELPDWIEGYMRLTENSEPPELFRYWSAISVVASALQRKCYVEWGTSLTFFPNLYIVLVGPSGTRKSTAMGPGLDLIEDLGRIQVASQATSYQALIRRLKETNYSDPDVKTGKMQFHASMTIFSKEFTVFLGFHNRELMSALCSWYDCERKWVYETIARKKEEIIGVWVNLIGATTPDLIRSSLPLDAIGGGLTSRIIYIFEERKGKIVEIPAKSKEEQELYQLLLYDLEKIHMLSGRYNVTEKFMDAWASWYRESEFNPPFQDQRFAGYIERRPTHLMKLSMVFAASERRDKDKQLVLTERDFEKALAALLQAERKMPYTFTGVGKSEIADVLQRAITYFGIGPDEVPVWKFARDFQSDLDKVSMDRVLETLEAMKFAVVIHRPGADPIIKVLYRPPSKK